MSGTSTLKAVATVTTLCVLAGLANSASAASCRSDRGRCQSPAVNAGADRSVTYRGTANIPFAPDFANVKVVETATGRFIRNVNFRGDTGFRRALTPTRGAYRCRVEAIGPDRGTVACSIN
jgi:hypothetical protein